MTLAAHPCLPASANGDGCLHSVHRPDCLHLPADLPANTLVLANFSACHRNPKYFPEPDQFNPDHFLDNGKLVTDKAGFLPYGIGPRVCPGAELADMQLFLIMSNILTVYSLELPEGDMGETGTQFEAGTSVLRNPKPYRVIFKLKE